MKHTMTALALTLFAIGSAGVFAQEPGEEQDQAQQDQQWEQQEQAKMEMEGKEFSQLDADGDGMVSETEAQEAGIEPVTFEAIDANANQQLEEEEFNQAKEGGAAR